MDDAVLLRSGRRERRLSVGECRDYRAFDSGSCTSKTVLLVLVLIATAGQMTGKCILYWAGRNGNNVLRGRAGQALAKWRDRLESRPGRAIALVLVSSVVGLPPFYLVTLVAGASRMNFLTYLTAGTVGRLVRFRSPRHLSTFGALLL